MATNRPQGDLVGLTTDAKHFQLEKTIEISFLDENPCPTNFGDSNPQPPSQSLVAFTPGLAHLAT